MIERIREGFLFHYPRDRRKVGYQHGVEGVEFSFFKSPWGMLVMLLMLDWAGLVDVVKVFQEAIQFNPLVILAFVLGAATTGALVGWGVFRKWAANPDPLKETRPRGRPPKNAK